MIRCVKNKGNGFIIAPARNHLAGAISLDEGFTMLRVSKPATPININPNLCSTKGLWAIDGQSPNRISPICGQSFLHNIFKSTCYPTKNKRRISRDGNFELLHEFRFPCRRSDIQSTKPNLIILYSFTFFKSNGIKGDTLWKLALRKPQNCTLTV